MSSMAPAVLSCSRHIASREAEWFTELEPWSYTRRNKWSIASIVNHLLSCDISADETANNQSEPK